MSFTISLGSFKGSHLIINQDKINKLLSLHPHTDDGFVHVVGGVVYDEAGRIYLHHDAKLNEFLLPGGKVELGESYEQALVRELKEELDIDILSVKHLSSVKYIGGGVRRCFHMFEVEDYIGIPVNNESDKLDQYRAKKLPSDNDIGFAVEIDGTVTDDVQDIMHSFLDVYHLWYIRKYLIPEQLLLGTYVEYDTSKISLSDHYYLTFDPQTALYRYII